MSKKTCLFIITSLLSVNLFASNHHTAEEERVWTITNFLIGATVAVGLKQGQQQLGLSGASHGVLQTANALWQLGSISGNSVFNDLSWRTIVAAASTATASKLNKPELIKNTPFVGEGLAAGGAYTHGLLTVSTYKATEIGMRKFCEAFPDLNMSFCESH